MASGLVTPPLAAVLGDGNISARQHLADTMNQQMLQNTYFQMLRSKAYDSASQTITSGSNTALTFDTNVDLKMGVDPFHSTTTNPTRFTASVTGLYLGFAQLNMNSSAAGSQRQLRVFINGVGQIITGGIVTFPPSASVANFFYHVSTGPMFLNFGDYVEYMAFQDSGGSLTTVAGGSWGSLILISRI